MCSFLIIFSHRHQQTPPHNSGSPHRGGQSQQPHRDRGGRQQQPGSANQNRQGIILAIFTERAMQALSVISCNQWQIIYKHTLEDYNIGKNMIVFRSTLHVHV